jgi:hypothetical protein
LLTEGDTVQINPGLPLWLDVEKFTRHKAQSAAASLIPRCTCSS